MESDKPYLWWRPPTSDIPAQPGVYRFSDKEGRIIYVGKAKNLRNRLVNYFQDPSLLHPRTAQMVASARSVQWTIVATEIEALTLEFQWIKELNPRFNVIFRDDKSYPYLSVSMGEEFPRVAISRDAKKKGTRYFGPYAQVWAIRETIDLLLNTFPVRTCAPGVFRRAVAQGRPCLLGYIDRCSAPCVGKISPAAHRELADELCSFMSGKTVPFVRRLEQEMVAAAREEDFESAARKRDEIQALEKVQERNAIVLSSETDADVYALVADELDAAIHVFYVRGGRVRGTRGWVIERLDERSESQLMSDLIEQTYSEQLAQSSSNGKSRKEKSAPVSVDDVEHTSLDVIPSLILTSVIPEEKKLIENWLGVEREAGVTIRVPQRGKKAELMETVIANAQHSLDLYKTKRAGDLTQRAQALEEIQEALGLENAPLRIECYDISHTAGQHRVASMVVFEDGTPRKDAYRVFNIIGDNLEGKQDDTAAMNEVLTRRFKRIQSLNNNGTAEFEENPSSEFSEDPLDTPIESGPIDPNTGRPRRFAYKPDLIVVDGGLPQVNAAKQALTEIGVTVPVVGLAKRLEEVWVPGDPFPVILPRASAGLYLLQHLRDESHRFAIKKHRAKRSKAQTRSALDKVPGLGPTRQRTLLKAFGSIKRIKEASVAELSQVEGIGLKTAEMIFESLKTQDKIVQNPDAVVASDGQKD